MEIAPDVHLLKIPLTGNPLGFVNCYVFKASDGVLLIDPGWNTEDAYQALYNQLSDIGIRFSDITMVVATHIHPDHYGMVGRIREYSNFEFILHDEEQRWIKPQFVEYEALTAQVDNWMKANGAPVDEQSVLKDASLELINKVNPIQSDRIVFGDEILTVGDFSLRVIGTPGHSPGHICLYDERKKLFVSGDHVLRRITSNVSKSNSSGYNPLVAYLDSLRKISSLAVDLVLPAHGDPFADFAHRIKEIENHHENRLNDFLSIFDKEPQTAFAIAKKARWYIAWDNMPAFSRRAAVLETIAHLELLVARDQLSKTLDSEQYKYALIPR